MSVWLTGWLAINSGIATAEQSDAAIANKRIHLNAKEKWENVFFCSVTWSDFFASIFVTIVRGLIYATASETDGATGKCRTNVMGLNTNLFSCLLEND